MDKFKTKVGKENRTEDDFLEELFIKYPIKFLVSTERWNKIVAILKNHKLEIERLKFEIQELKKRIGLNKRS